MFKRVLKAGMGLALAATIMVTPLQEALACTGIYVGSDFTENGSTYFGRAEDKDMRSRKVFGVQPASTDNAGKVYCNLPDRGMLFERPYPAETYRFTYVRDTSNKWDGDETAYAEAGINEYGVSASSTVSISAKLKSKDGYPNTGVAEYNLNSIILGESKTAREGIDLIGDILDTYGAGEGFQVFIADPNETWMLSALTGHQWIALNLSSDVVSVNPNIASLQFQVDFSNPEICRHSAALLTSPTTWGVTCHYFEPTEEGQEADDPALLNIGRTYGTIATGGTAKGFISDGGVKNLTRYAQARFYFEPEYVDTLELGVNYSESSNGEINGILAPELFFTPSVTNMSSQYIFNSLAYRGQGSGFSAADMNNGKLTYPVCNSQQMEAHFFEVRQGMDPDIATIQWLSIARSGYGVYLPSYSALLTDVADCYADGPIGHTSEDALVENPDVEGSIAYNFVDINSICEMDHDQYGTDVRTYLDSLQAEIIAQQSIVDAYIVTLPQEERSAFATEAAINLANNVNEKAGTLLTELRAHAIDDRDNNGGVATPFTPSDMNEDSSLKEPLVYAATVVPPSVDTQPQSATYNKGAAADPLTIEASGDTVLSYQWFEIDGNNQEVQLDGTDASYIPDTSTVGSRTYFVRVTNQSGLTSDSDYVTITINEAAVVADAAQNSFSLAGGQSIKAGTPFTIMATGHRCNEVAVVAGDERYIPITASANPTVSFTQGSPYTAQMTIDNPGNYTLSVTFEHQSWDGTSWVATGNTDIKSQDITVFASETVGNDSGSANDSDQKSKSLSKTGDASPLVATAVSSLCLLLLTGCAYRFARKKG